MNSAKLLLLPIYLVLNFFLALPQPLAFFQGSKVKNVLLEKGDQLYDQFDNHGALSLYKQAFAEYPGDYEVLVSVTKTLNALGEESREQGKKEKAEEYFDKAITHAKLLSHHFPDSAASYFYLAATSGNLALYQGGKQKVKLSRDVEKNCKKAIAIDPKFGLSYMVLGIYYREVANLNWFLKAFAKTIYGGLPGGSNEDSEKMLLKSIVLMPENIRSYYELALTYRKMKREEETIRYLEKVLQFSPGYHLDAATQRAASIELEELRGKRR